MIDPSRLLDSAKRIYGAQMDTLWGAFIAVPEDNIQPLEGGETIEACGLRFAVAYTPGHASHHVSYLDIDEGTAWVGDTGGIRIGGQGIILPVTPPPDINVEQWKASIAAIRAWRPERIVPAHFGATEDVDAHFERLDAVLDDWAEKVRLSLDDDRTDQERAKEFGERLVADIREQVGDGMTPAYLSAVGPVGSWYGLARYWRKRWEA